MSNVLDEMSDIQRGITCVFRGEITFPPPRLAEPSAPPASTGGAKKDRAPREETEVPEAQPSWLDHSISVGDQEILSMREFFYILAAAAFTIILGILAPESFVALLFILMLACAV